MQGWAGRFFSYKFQSYSHDRLTVVVQTRRLFSFLIFLTRFLLNHIVYICIIYTATAAFCVYRRMTLTRHVGQITRHVGQIFYFVIRLRWNNIIYYSVPMRNIVTIHRRSLVSDL